MHENERFEAIFTDQRAHLRAVAFRLLGSLEDANDAVQEAWLRANDVDVHAIDNVPGWLVTIVSRLCLDKLKARRRSNAMGIAQLDEELAHTPEEAHLLAESVGLALLVVMERLGPFERVAFVLHDLLGVPFEDVAKVIDRTTSAAKKLASRARQRVRGASPMSARAQHDAAIVEAFLCAARAGDVDALLSLLAPDLVRRVDAAARDVDAPVELRGADAIAKETAGNATRARAARVMLIDGHVGAVVAPLGQLRLLLRFELLQGARRITAIDVVGDPATLARATLRRTGNLSVS